MVGRPAAAQEGVDQLLHPLLRVQPAEEGDHQLRPQGLFQPRGPGADPLRVDGVGHHHDAIRRDPGPYQEVALVAGEGNAAVVLLEARGVVVVEAAHHPAPGALSRGVGEVAGRHGGRAEAARHASDRPVEEGDAHRAVDDVGTEIGEGPLDPRQGARGRQRHRLEADTLERHGVHDGSAITVQVVVEEADLTAGPGQGGDRLVAVGGEPVGSASSRVPEPGHPHRHTRTLRALRAGRPAQVSCAG